MSALIKDETKCKVKLEHEKELPAAMWFHRYNLWVATDFASSMKNEFLYVMQPVEEMNGIEIITGLSAIVVNEEEFNKFFEIVDNE